MQRTYPSGNYISIKVFLQVNEEDRDYMYNTVNELMQAIVVGEDSL